jgi:hypothetical protein
MRKFVATLRFVSPQRPVGAQFAAGLHAARGGGAIAVHRGDSDERPE